MHIKTVASDILECMSSYTQNVSHSSVFYVTYIKVYALYPTKAVHKFKAMIKAKGN